MQLSTKSMGWHFGSVAAGAVAGVSFAASGGVDLYAIYAELKGIYGEIIKLIAMLGPVITVAAAAYRTYNEKQVPSSAIAIQPGVPVSSEDQSGHVTVTAPGGSPVTVAGKVVGALLIGILLCGLWVIPSSAATPLPPVDLMTKISNVSKEIVDGIVQDLTAALADASSVDPDTNKPRDAISAACYPQQIKFLQSLPSAQSLTGKFILVQLFQRKRDFVIQLQKGLPVELKIGCGALLGDETNIFIKTMALVGVAVAAPAIAPMLPAVGILPVLPGL